MNKHDATIYLKGIKDFYGLDKDSEEAIDMAIEALQEPEQKTREWTIQTCPKCGKFVINDWIACPYCGAKMGGDTE